jgi:hypothetical protein
MWSIPRRVSSRLRRRTALLADETTYRATPRAIEYGERRAVAAKGKAQPVRVWEVLQARARVHVERGGRAPLVGREKELEVLRAALRRAREDREPQLVTLVGVPGIGKSRIVYELFEEIEVGGELTFWRQGRSLPYGDGVSYWALGEMVKSQAGRAGDGRRRGYGREAARGGGDAHPGARTRTGSGAT